MSAPPISSFSCPSLRSLLDTLDLSLPDNKAAYDTHNDQNNHSTGQADTKENNNKSSLLDKGETFDEKRAVILIKQTTRTQTLNISPFRICNAKGKRFDLSKL